MDRIHERYVSYINQSSTQRDSTKTDFTYARSYSYRPRMDASLMEEWMVPNMCRKSCASGHYSQQMYLNQKPEVETPFKQLISLFMKTLSFKEFADIPSKREILKSDEYIADNEANDRLFKYRRLSHLKVPEKRKHFQFLAIFIIICVLILISSFYLNQYFRSFAIILLKERTDCETNQLNEKSESIGIDSKSLPQELLQSKEMSVDWEPNVLSHTNSHSDYLICSSEQKPDFKPKHGVLELVSILSTERHNSYKSLYRFKTDD